MNWEITTPIIAALIGAFTTWLVQKNLQEKRDIERRLAERRQNIYMKLLDPYIKLFSVMGENEKQEVVKNIASYDYRKISFNLGLMGSDEVVKAYNKMMKFMYKTEKEKVRDNKEMLRLWGKLLLEIRKSLGNKGTKLDEWNMLEGMIKDLDDLRTNNKC